MKTRTYRITEAELAVLRLLWRRGSATIRELTAELYPGGGTSAYSTVQKLLDRLESKGCVGRRRGAPNGGPPANVFSPRVSRADVVAGRLREIADVFFDGAMSPLLTHLVHGSNLDAEDFARLRALVEELDEGGSEPR